MSYEWPAEIEGGNGVESFEYAQNPHAQFVPSWSGWENAPDAAAVESGSSGGVKGNAAGAELAGGAEFERRLEEERRRSFEAGRARGLEEGRKAERQAREEILAVEQEKRIRHEAALIGNLAEERERYFHALGPEIVRLAMAIAARILRREASSDPLLLLGAVRAALGQISAATEVRLRVPAAEIDLWTEAIKLLPNSAVRPAVLIGEGLTLGDCTIETALGSADLGIRAQLAEVERVLLANGARHQEQSSGSEPAQVESGA